MPDMILGCGQCGAEHLSNGLKVICPNCGLSGVENFTLKGYPKSEPEEEDVDEKSHSHCSSQRNDILPSPPEVDK